VPGAVETSMGIFPSLLLPEVPGWLAGWLTGCSIVVRLMHHSWGHVNVLVLLLACLAMIFPAILFILPLAPRQGLCNRFMNAQLRG